RFRLALLGHDDRLLQIVRLRGTITLAQLTAWSHLSRRGCLRIGRRGHACGVALWIGGPGRPRKTRQKANGDNQGGAPGGFVRHSVNLPKSASQSSVPVSVLKATETLRRDDSGAEK